MKTFTPWQLMKTREDSWEQTSSLDQWQCLVVLHQIQQCGMKKKNCPQGLELELAGISSLVATTSRSPPQTPILQVLLESSNEPVWPRCDQKPHEDNDG